MKIGIIGLGSIGKRHANNLIALGHEVYCYDPAHPDGFQNIKPLTAVFDGVDGFVIASPTKQHYEDLRQYALTGKPLFVEKPIASQLISGVFDIGPIRMVGYNLRYHACVEAARQWLVDGEIGDPIWANFTVAQLNTKSDYRSDGVILNWSHEIDLALYLLGPADVITSATKLEDGQDVLCDICLKHRISAAHSVVHLDYLTKPEIRQTIIAGTDGQIIVDLVNRSAWLRDPRNNIRDHLGAQDSFDLNYREEMADFIDLIKGKAKGVHCTGSEAIAVLDICMEVRKQAGL